jgi:hypothetical protein
MPHEELVIASSSPFQGARCPICRRAADDLRLDRGAGVVIVDIATARRRKALASSAAISSLGQQSKIAEKPAISSASPASRAGAEYTIVRGGPADVGGVPG